MDSTKEIIKSEMLADGILLLTFAPPITSEDLKLLQENITNLEEKIEKARHEQRTGIRVLIDISHFDAEYVYGAVDLMVDLARRDRVMVKKTASFGGSEKARLIGETIAALAGRENIKLFETRAQAIAWLKKD